MIESYREWNSFGEYLKAIRDVQDGIFDPRLESGAKRNWYPYFLRMKLDKQIQAANPPVELTGEKPKAFNQN